MNFHIDNPEPLISTIAAMLKAEGAIEIIEVLANSGARIERTDYDNIDGGVYLYTLYLSVPIKTFSKFLGKQTDMEETILRTAKLVAGQSPGHCIYKVELNPQIEYDISWRLPHLELSMNELLQELLKQKDLMTSVSTGGPQIKSVNQDFVQRQETIEKAFKKFQIEASFPFKDLWGWYGRWSSGDLPSYQSRREYLSRLFNPILDQIKRRLSGNSSFSLTPTGWARVDRGVDKIRIQIEKASQPEDFQGIGLLCREVLISLAENVFKRIYNV